MSADPTNLSAIHEVLNWEGGPMEFLVSRGFNHNVRLC